MSPARFLILLLPLILLGPGLGCRKAKAAPDPTQGFTATQLLEKGEAEVKVGRMEDGRRWLRTIEEQLPSTPEFPRAKLLLADSFFFAATPSYPEALVEYQSFLNIFPRHELRDYALYRIALCHYASIESAERDQSETRRALDTFRQLLREHPGSPYVTETKAKVIQCYRRLAESELLVGIFYVNTFHFEGAEKRLKELLETHPEYVDRERAYYYLGEALRRKYVPMEAIQNWEKAELAKFGKDDFRKLSKAELAQFKSSSETWSKDMIARYRGEARDYFRKLVESYPASAWAGRARDRLVEMGQGNVKEELDS
ncbi:MAG: outer membrane protein assembly factor BamD [Acidobacteria bacterium]|nr:outer membrane protein assembly factor BamD [Acidobacteriota bacterium]